jgi:NADP-dependent aldehyde dehydrogenase
MEFHGRNFIGSELSSLGGKLFYAFDPRHGRQLNEAFHQATGEEIDRAVELAVTAFASLREKPARDITHFLEAIAIEIEALGDTLIDRAALESGLPKERLIGERARTVGQLRLFAALVKEGSFVDARIDEALPERKPLPRPDIRRMLIPIGPIAVFGASNFPLAFSVAGGDTASAFSAKNPLIVKAHPAHPGTCELVATAILRAVEQTGMPAGTFSMIHATDPEVSIQLVKHRGIKAVAFTGSERAGRAIFNAAAQRAEPIPAYVEMGSNNPVFLLPGALEKSGDSIAQSLFGSINLGVGQFCTSPGVIVGRDNPEFGAFGRKLASMFETAAPGTMLHPNILKAFAQGTEHRGQTAGIDSTRSAVAADPAKTEASPVLFEALADVWLANKELASEVFGPSAILVRARSREELLRIAREWTGTLTASIFGTPEELAAHADLVAILEQKAGRIIFNGVPTGLEVSHAMHHGGPYPATADAKFTSVGTAAILRFLRPVCYQNFPAQALPDELRDENPRGIWRLVNGTFTKDQLKTPETKPSN